ncbi:cytochrome P450 monooxygenase-like protein [Hypoxylon rubiginosum]|uniref:Cytochrome P450 monooxygenase-like protein n=1 Tax=Hypoxylon rubiginosum TaxID=110542 RepID=A0ACB9YH31_9PEZI|nr:cytochrome P450 monooxygenase-like protein [Hypoxylon rubiginosum]
MLQIVLAIVGGLVAHHVFLIHGEWHLSGHHIVVSHVLLGSCLLYLSSQVHDKLEHAISWTALSIACYFGALFGSMTIYRLFFHKTSHFPGPKWASITKFWHIYQVRDSRNYLFQERLFKKYGTFVRTGPNEISIFHPAGIQLLDGWNNHNTKDIWYDVLQPRSSAIFTRDELNHKERRKVWTQSLSTKAMDSLRPRLASQAEALYRCIAGYGDKPVDVDEVMSWFSFDAMGEVVFGEDFDLMNSKVMHPAILHRDRALALLGPISDAIWIARLAFSFVPFYGRVRDWFRMVAFCDERMRIRMQRGPKEGKTDMASWFIEEHQRLANVMDLKSRSQLLSGTATSAVVAGSDTTRASLIATWWFLSKYPKDADKIYSEIQDVDVHDANVLATLPHLNGVINEILRLVPPAMTGGGRITGPDGLMIDGTLIPPYTKVTAPKYVIMRMASAFESPDDFIPERWYSRPELVHDKRAFGPFSFGSRQCVGKVLAYAELRLVIAVLIKHFTVQFAPGYDPETMWRDMKDQVTAQPGQVLCIFRPRSARL